MITEPGPGHNNPPEATPFDLSKQEIDDLVMEAKNWLDGLPIRSQDEADQIGALIDGLRKAISAADARRVEENKPFDEGKAAVQAKYAPLIADTKREKGAAVRALEACKVTLTAWLTKVEDEKRAAAEAARKEAEEKAAIAQAAIRAASGADFATKEDAEDLLRQAKQAEKVAKKVEAAPVGAFGGSRAVGLRRSWKPVLTDATEAARWAWRDKRGELEAFLVDLAEKEVRTGARSIPGFDVIEERGVA